MYDKIHYKLKKKEKKSKTQKNTKKMLVGMQISTATMENSVEIS